jgi:hypothetical protein
LEKLRREKEKLVGKNSTSKKMPAESDESDSEGEEDDVSPLAPMETQKKISQNARTSVSAEAFGRWNKKAAF